MNEDWGHHYADRIAQVKDAPTPVVNAMRFWLTNPRSVPTLEEFYGAFGNQYRAYRRDWTAMVDTQTTLCVTNERSLFIKEFGFAVPTRQALAALQRFDPILEVGAGTGSWTRLLAGLDVDVIATDAYLEKFKFGIGAYHKVLKVQAKRAVRRWPERNVFCSWPSLGQTWLRQAAKAMRPGRSLLVVREDATAEDTTWDYIFHNFTQIADIELPAWHYCHDTLEVWTKKGRNKE